MLLAVLSLLLLLVISGIVTTILLRTRDGEVSTFSSVVKQVMELAREFRLRRIWEGSRGSHGVREQSRRSRIDVRLVTIAVIAILGRFGLEVLVLFLTNRESRAVSKRSVALELLYPNKPDWAAVRFHNCAYINRPCTMVSLIGNGVEQDSTCISGCTSTVGSDVFDIFKKAELEQRITIITDVHELGMEHGEQIGDEKEEYYSGRAYFILDDDTPKIMVRRAENRFVRQKLRRSYTGNLAYLFSIYNIDINFRSTVVPYRCQKMAEESVKEVSD